MPPEIEIEKKRNLAEVGSSVRSRDAEIQLAHSLIFDVNIASVVATSYLTEP